jgi:hypothetical protein
MPANPEQIHAAFHQIGRQLAARAESEHAARRAALQLLEACALEPRPFRAAAEAAAASEPTLRCALPLAESAAAGYTCSSQLRHYRVIAVDGSQSIPDRHAEVPFALVNVAAVAMDDDAVVPGDALRETDLVHLGSHGCSLSQIDVRQWDGHHVPF